MIVDFPERIRAVMMAEETQKEFAARVGLSENSITNYVKGKSKPSRQALEKIAKATGCSLQFLMTGEGPKFPRAGELSDNIFLKGDGLEPYPLGQARPIPVIGMVEAGNFQKAEDGGFPVGISDDVVYSDIKGNNLFAVRVINDSMEPEFTEGDIVIINPNLEAKSGDFVIAKNGEEEVTVKKLVVKGSTSMLVPLNPKYDPILIDGPHIRIIGKVVEKKKMY